jgi:uncharacterized spore protein YtfJ
MEKEPMSELEFSEESPSSPIEGMNETLTQLLYSAHVDAVYGEPVEHGENLIIPAAEVFSVAGFGMGSGGQGKESGQGGGGGGRTFSRPVAVIISTPTGVRVEPVIDISKVWMAALTALGFFFAASHRMRRGRIT